MMKEIQEKHNMRDCTGIINKRDCVRSAKDNRIKKIELGDGHDRES